MRLNFCLKIILEQELLSDISYYLKKFQSILDSNISFDLKVFFLNVLIDWQNWWDELNYPGSIVYLPYFARGFFAFSQEVF